MQIQRQLIEFQKVFSSVRKWLILSNKYYRSIFDDRGNVYANIFISNIDMLMEWLLLWSSDNVIICSLLALNAQHKSILWNEQF